MLIPNYIEDFDSMGEKILYLRFKNDKSTDKMFILHSLFTNHHLKNISGELDFLVLAPNEGVFAIEVKHGGVSRKNGVWHFTNRNGYTTIKNKSPFAQVDGTINSVRDFILKKVAHKERCYNRLSKIMWGTGVAFTSMQEFVDYSPEGHSWQILTKQGLNLPIGDYIATLSKGWHNENKNKYWYDAHQARPTEQDCKLILKILRGDFDINYSEINKINENEILIEEYTKEQFALLDFVNYNDRCIIEGPAGTGKTIMALEIAQRKLLKKDRVGLFCYNKQLGKKLQQQISDLTINKNSEIFAGTLHSFLSKYTKSTPPSKNREKYYSEDLPFEFLTIHEELPENERYDFLIIDEAQDLVSPYYLEVFDLILKGGIKNGKWVLFGDFSNQAIYLQKPEKVFQLLISKTNFTRFPPLKFNCRNTKKIASHNTLLTGIIIPEFKSSWYEGTKVVSKFPAKNAQKEVIESILKEKVKTGIPLKNITLLSPKQFKKTYLYDSELILGFYSEGLQISTIQGYKGLENTIVILFDFEEIHSLTAQRLLYIGISRPRQELFIILEQSQEDSYNRLIQDNYSKLNQHGN